MITREHLREVIIEHILIEQPCIQASEEEFNDTMTFEDEIGMDSLDMAQMCVYLERKFQVKIPDYLIESEMNTLGKFINEVLKIINS